MIRRTGSDLRVRVWKDAESDMGRCWKWYCPCCKVSSGYKYGKWSLAFWAATRHVHFWHGKHWAFREGK